MKIKSFSEKGRRLENEDYILSKAIDKNSSLHIMADGMGGYTNGRIAAKMVANTIYDFIHTNHLKFNSSELIKAAVAIANAKIAKLINIEHQNMGATLGGTLIIKNKVFAFWVGDVKIMHIHSDDLLFESKDHSLINQMKDNGAISENINLNHMRHIVTRSIGGADDNFQPDIHSFECEANEQIIICSDGILETSPVHQLVKQPLQSDEDFALFQENMTNNRDNSSLILIER